MLLQRHHNTWSECISEEKLLLQWKYFIVTKHSEAVTGFIWKTIDKKKQAQQWLAGTDLAFINQTLSDDWLRCNVTCGSCRAWIYFVLELEFWKQSLHLSFALLRHSIVIATTPNCMILFPHLTILLRYAHHLHISIGKSFLTYTQFTQVRNYQVFSQNSLCILLSCFKSFIIFCLVGSSLGQLLIV